MKHAPATLSPDVVEASKNLYQRLVDVTKAVGRVPKRGRNSFHNYDYATEADVAEAVRDALCEHGVVMLSTLADLHDREVTTSKGKVETVVTATLEVTFVNADNPEERTTIRMAGSGQDGGDKAVMKAITAAAKYAQLKTFSIPTGDDPEADTKTDEAAQDRAPRRRTMADPAPTGPVSEADIAELQATCTLAGVEYEKFLQWAQAPDWADLKVEKMAIYRNKLQKTLEQAGKSKENA